MHLRAPATTTLDDVAKDWSTMDRTWNSDACVPEADFTPGSADPTLRLGDHTLRLDEGAIARLCAFYGIPAAFFRRLTAREQHYVMNSRISHAEGEVTITYDQVGLVDIHRPTQPRLDPGHFLQAARRLYPAAATVLDYWVDADDLRLDVLSPHPLEHGLRGGLRLAQNRKQNLAPTVAPLLFHEETTSVIHITDPSLKIDARREGQSPERLAQVLTSQALRADARLSADASALVDLDHVSIAEDRLTRLQRAAEEHGLPVRPLAGISAALAAEDKATLLTLVLAIANAANGPKLAASGQRAARTRLQTIAGALVIDHAERCPACHALIPAA